VSRMLKVLAFPFGDRKRLMQKLCDHESKRIIPLRSDKEVEDFLAQQMLRADEQSYETLSQLPEVHYTVPASDSRLREILRRFLTRISSYPAIII